MTQTAWAYLSNNFIYSAMGVFALSLVVHAFETAWAVRVPVGGTDHQKMDYSKAEKAARIGTSLMSLAFILLFVGIIARGFANGHVPWGNMYEFSITSALAFVGAYLIALRKYDLRWLGLFISLAALLTLGTAVTLLYRDSAPLVPALNSAWLIIHVITAVISGGVFLFSNIIAGAFLYLDSRERGLGRPAWADRLPSLDFLDQLSYRLVAFVFPLWTFSVIAGAIWAESAWGRYWGWDPKETWALIVWLNYAAWLHYRIVKGLRGSILAWWALIGLIITTFAFLGVNMFLSGLHSYGEL